MDSRKFDNLIISEETMPVISQLAESIPGGFFIYHADGNQELIYFNSHLPAIFGCENEEDFREFVGNSFKGIVHPDDYAENENDILTQIKESASKNDHVRYRFIRKDGSMGMMDDYGHFSHSDTFGDIYYVFVQDITDHYREELEHRDNIVRIMALEDNFESLYDVDLETGEYNQYVKGQTFSDSVKERLVEHNEFFSDVLKNVELVVYPEDREKFKSIVNREFCRKILSDRSYYDSYYRLLIDERPVWFRMRLVYKDSEKRNLIIGSFYAEEEVSERERQTEKRNVIIKQMIGGESIYSVNIKKDEFTVIERTRYLDETYSKNERYSVSVGKYIDRDVYELDRERMRKAVSLSNLRKKFKTENEVIEIFRDVSSGIPCWYKMRVVKISESDVILGFINIDNDYYNDLIHEKIQDDYFGMYIADLDAQIFRITKSSPYYSAGKVGQTAPYVPALLGFANANRGEAKKFFENLSDIGYIRKTFAKEDKISFSYKSPVIDGHKWVTAECMVLTRHDDGTPAMFALGFKGIDTLTIERNELQEKLNAIRVVMETLTEDFGCVNYVEFQPDKKDDIAVNYRTSELLKKTVPGWENEKYFAEKIRMLVDCVVLESDREEFYENIRRERICKELSDKDTYFVIFKAFVEGEIRYYQIKVTAVREDGKLIGTVIGIHSVDEYIKKELAIQAKLENALESAEIANSSKTKFLFNMSHDIRTPMNAILGFTSMAQNNIEDHDKLIDYLGKIGISGQQLLVLINQILEMSRIESGKVTFENKPVNIKDEFNSMITVFSERAKELGLNFSCLLKDVTHSWILADVARMNSITLNIVGNALKYTPKGGEIYYELREIEPRKEGYATFTFVVSDTGIGMSEEYQKILFEPFTREKSTTVSKIQGTGLGMSIVNELVKLLGGTIAVKSKLGEGTRFDVTIDFEIAEEESTVSETRQDISDISLKDRRVLLVEDNELNREIALDILNDEGLITEEAEDGDVAVDIMKEKGPDYYDFILMDIQMPIMDGYEATKAIRKMYPDKHIPIIALSANAFAEDKAASIEAGMDDHVSKPINIQELFNTLAKYL